MITTLIQSDVSLATLWAAGQVFDNLIKLFGQSNNPIELSDKSNFHNVNTLPNLHH